METYSVDFLIQHLQDFHFKIAEDTEWYPLQLSSLYMKNTKKEKLLIQKLTSNDILRLDRILKDQHLGHYLIHSYSFPLDKFSKIMEIAKVSRVFLGIYMINYPFNADQYLLLDHLQQDVLLEFYRSIQYETYAEFDYVKEKVTWEDISFALLKKQADTLYSFQVGKEKIVDVLKLGLICSFENFRFHVMDDTIKIVYQNWKDSDDLLVALKAWGKKLNIPVTFRSTTKIGIDTSFTFTDEFWTETEIFLATIKETHPDIQFNLHYQLKITLF